LPDNTPARGGLIDGVALARKIRARMAEEAASLAARGVTPGLTVVLVGDDPASAVYVRAKGRACDEVGIRSNTIVLPASTGEEELLDLVDALNAEPSVHGILVQMPLPKQIDADVIIRRIDPAKDVDGFHPVNVGLLLAGSKAGFAPCTPAGVMAILRAYGVETRGADVVVIGRSNIVGKPMVSLLIQSGADADATVTVCHSRTRDLAGHVRQADIVIAAVGRPQLVTADMVKPGAVVIDVGVNRVADAGAAKGFRLVGDVDFDGVKEVASLITPVPGGVGPMTPASWADGRATRGSPC
jgi:methylenetetrahydrofolate dehydrogenase (NADP+) / methenyltetrahydrofolate cyclohydrolase